MIARLCAGATRVLGLFGRQRRDRDLDAELESNLALAVDDLINEGIAREEAIRRARLQFGSIEAAKEQYRERRGLPFLEVLGRDMVYAFRQFRKSPGVFLAALTVLALAVGANTAVFSVLRTSLAGVPFDEADRLVRISVSPPDGAAPLSVLSVPEYLALRDRTQAFEAVGALLAWPYNVGAAEDGLAADGVLGWRYTDTLFDVLRFQPQLGRAFNEAENVLDAPAGSAIISDGLWQRRFGGRSDVLGEEIDIDGVATTIVGVMPKGFRLFDPAPGPDIWTPLPFLQAQLDSANTGAGTRFITVLARLGPGVSLEQAQTDVTRLTFALAQEYPAGHAGWTLRVESLNDAYFGDARTLLLILQATVGLVLLIACANVGGLLVARAAVRRHEVAVRFALGAHRSRIVRQFLTEGSLLAAGAGGLGLALAWAAVELWNRAPLDVLGYVPRVVVDPIVLAFTGGATMLTALMFAAVPAMQSARGDLPAAMRSAGRGGGAQNRVLQRGLVAAQIAITLVLLIGAGLLVKSFVRLQEADLGANPEGVLMFETRLPQAQYQRPAGAYNGHRMLESSPLPAEIFERMRQRLSEVPGVVAVGGMTWNPLSGTTREVPFLIDGRPVVDGTTGAQTADYYMATPGLFETLEMPLLRGRGILPSDTSGSPWVAVISETMARRYWPGEDPIGQRVRLDLTPDEQLREIVGVVGDLARSPRDRQPVPMLWVARAQQPQYFLTTYGQRTQMTYVLRLRDDVSAVLPGVRRAVALADPSAPVANVELLDTAVGRQIQAPRFYMVFVGAFGVVALALAVVGLYALVSFAVTERRREIAVRMALGAGAHRVVRLILGEGALLVAAGLALGVAGALAATRYMDAMLWEAAPTDPMTFTSVPLLLAAVTLLANLVPAMRALRLEPKTVLRED